MLRHKKISEAHENIKEDAHEYAIRSLLELGEVLLENNGTGHHILFLSVIGEIEGHHLSSDRIKTTKYEHLLPLLTQVQDNQEIDGLFLLINTVGGDCSCALRQQK